MTFLYRNRVWLQNTGFMAFQVVLIATFMVSMTSTSFAATKTCPQDQAMKAMSEASNLKTWDEVFKSYRKYKHCDDGAIAEGYSASVAYLLASRWTDIETLVRLSNANPYFRRFVINHIDETMNMDQGKSIKKNAATKCPSKAKHLCVAIQQRFVELGF